MHLPLSVKYGIPIYEAWLCQKNWLDFTWCWLWQLLNPGILQTVKLQSWPWWPTFHISWQRYKLSPCVFVALECVKSSLNFWNVSHEKFSFAQIFCLPWHYHILNGLYWYQVLYCMQLCYLSGILTVFFCGIVMSHYTWHNISESSRVTTKYV